MDAAFERAKNQKLMDFILGHGFTVSELNDFTQNGILKKTVNDMNIIEPKKNLTGTPMNAHQVLASKPDLISHPSGSSSLPEQQMSPIILPHPSLPKPPLSDVSSVHALSVPNKSWSSIVQQNTSRSQVCLEYFPPVSPSSSDALSSSVRPLRSFEMEISVGLPAWWGDI